MPTRTPAQPHASITLLLPRLSGWIPQLDETTRFPAVEKLLARGNSAAIPGASLDALRMRLFGMAAGEEVPVAALGLLAAGAIQRDDHSYHLRLDPVSLQADMSRVVLMRAGFGGMPDEYRQDVARIIQQTVTDAGLRLQAGNGDGLNTAAEGADHWTLTLPEPPGVNFTSLDEALGDDVADCLPPGKAGQRWRLLANEIQMALHASPANEQRRQQGGPVINGAWFWGGGRLPGPIPVPAFDTVYSMDPVSSGLARLHGTELQPLSGLLAGDEALPGERAHKVLVDWAVPASAPQAGATLLTPDALDDLCSRILAWTGSRGGWLELHTPEFRCRLGRSDRWRFWRKPKPLRTLLQSRTGWPESSA